MLVGVRLASITRHFMIGRSRSLPYGSVISSLFQRQIDVYANSSSSAFASFRSSVSKPSVNQP